MNKEIKLILKDADPNTPGETEVTVGWSNQGIEITPAGTGTYDSEDGAPIFIERYKGHVRVIIHSDINKEEPTHIVSLGGAWRSLEGQVEDW